MGIAELIILAFGLAMDAFAVSICKGLAMHKVSVKEGAVVGLWFGGFQALMPLIGFFLGASFESYITKIDHWIAFILLALIGGIMIKEAFSKDEDETDGSLAVKTMLVMAIATSIDALAIGISFGILPEVNIWLAISLIGIITLVMCMIGVKIGNVFGAKYKSKAELTGGIILVLLGLKILLEHLGVINF
ncbi:MAG: manganese efflux pump [Clostridia bacterium]|nr:manganese efflux pump [Clostridia bacterium]